MHLARRFLFAASRLVVLVAASLILGSYQSAIGHAREPDCMPNEAHIVVEFPEAESDVDRERAAFLQKELNAVAFGGADVDGRCLLRIYLRRSQALISGSEQGFHIVRTEAAESAEAIVTAATSLGLVYGTYEILDRLGVRFASTSITVLPREFDWTLVPVELTLAPIIPLRGTWVFGDDRDPEFLLWAGRNRLNLVGGRFSEGEVYRRIFGIGYWAGGHNVISRLTPTDRPVAGVMLADDHPEWFGGGANARDRIPYDSESYQNPCFGDDAYVRHFIDRLVEAIANGEYRGARVINLWPSDQVTLIVPSDCRHAAGSRSALDDFIHFTREVVRAVATDPRLNEAPSRPTIAGISYESSYDFGESSLDLVDGTNPYLHIFYQNLRSHRHRFFDSASETNATLAKALQRTTERHSAARIGIVEYHNFSIYYGMFLAGAEQYAADIRDYSARGAHLYAYMHPSIEATVPEMLLHRVITRTAFGTEDAAGLTADFHRRVLRESRPVGRALELYEQAISHRTEFFGPNISLATVLAADVWWEPPLLSAKQIGEIARAYIDGGKVSVPPLRISWLELNNGKVPSIRHAIELLEQSQQEISVTDSSARTRAEEILAADIARALHIHLALLKFAQARIAGIDGDLAGCWYAAAKFEAEIATIANLPWPRYVSTFDLDKRYQKTQRALLHHVYTKACPRS